MSDYSSIHVLIIDDEPSICDSLSAFLIDYGFRASTAINAEEALNLMKNNVYDVCIVDMNLPGMSGEELIREAKVHYPEQQHIIYTGSITYNLSDKLKELGIRPEHVFLKPVRVLSLLVKCIKELASPTEQIS
ncbi:MAG TPA: response regulator [Pontiella sp.]